MRYVCIDSSDPNPFVKCTLKEGELYTLDFNKRCEDGCCVLVVEDGHRWMPKRFVPISDIDETEFVNETELICKTV